MTEKAIHSPHPLAADGETPPPDLSQRLEYLCLGSAEAERLRGLLPYLRDVGNQFVEAFYQHLFSFEHTSRFLQDPHRVSQLKVTQRAHLESMLAAVWDEDYVADRHRVGGRHAEVGIDPQTFLGAYCQYLQFCFRHVAGDSPKPPAELAEDLLALIKAVLLDTGLTLDAYFAHSTQSLRSALDMLWKANTELRQFAHLTSHDLKTPLATVANLCEEAIDEFGDQMPAQARELIEAARQRTFRMSAMINELLSAVSTTDDSEIMEHVELQSVLEDVFDRLRTEAQKKQVELAMEPPLPHVWGNRVRLREAFYNLVANAVKFCDKRPGRVVVAASSGNSEPVVVVADNGPGIPAEELEAIFSPFRRLAVHRDQPGSGLGLYFTRNLIDRQGGRVWAESTLGKGSRFCVLLKRRE
jgi:signal transduction histidine kinase